MESFFGDIFTWVESLSPAWTYLVIFAIAYGENIVPPIPGDMIVVFGGYLAGISSINFFAVWGLATLGGALGFMSMYAVGYLMGDAIYDPERLKWLPKRHLERVRVWLLEWGYWVVVANRFLSGARSVISLAVGISKMSPWRTFLAATLSALVWTGLIGYAGYAVGENWEIVSVYLKAYGWFILGAMALVAAFFAVRRYVVRRRAVERPG